MKLHLKKEVKVQSRNILGKPEGVEEWYLIYKWTLKGRRYLNVYIPNPAGVVYTELVNGPLPSKITFHWYKGSGTRFTLEEAKFFIKDIINNPHRYICHD